MARPREPDDLTELGAQFVEAHHFDQSHVADLILVQRAEDDRFKTRGRQRHVLIDDVAVAVDRVRRAHGHPRAPEWLALRVTGAPRDLYFFDTPPHFHMEHEQI